MARFANPNWILIAVQSF